MKQPKPDLSAKRAITLLHPGKGNGRRFALVSKVLSSMGLRHSAVIPFLGPLFGPGKLGRLEQAALADPHCQKIRKIPANTEVLIGTSGQIAKETADKKLVLSFDTKGFLSGEANDESFFHPILFHPDLVSEACYEEAAERSKNLEREVGVLFAGNCDPGAYASDRMERNYGVLNRIEIEALAKNLPNDRVYFPKSVEHFEEERKKGALKDRLVWIDTNRFRIPQSQWLAFIARSRFFICTPGVQYPYCQNLNEAAACGSVPILQYPTAYSPALANKGNALVFDGREDFGSVVSDALEMKAKEWTQLSMNAISYHHDHLSLSALQKRLEHFFNDEKRLQLTWTMAGKQR